MGTGIPSDEVGCTTGQSRLHNEAVEPTPNSLRSFLAPAIGRGSPLACSASATLRDDMVGNQVGCP